MSGKTRASLLSLTIIAVIIFSAFAPATIAYADGETPETPPVEATTAPEEARDKETSTETTSESTEATSEAVPSEASDTKEAVAESAEAEPVLAEVPENTTVTVLDANGESQPLATQEAADAIAESDPIWCPAGASPIPGSNGCTGSFGSFDELLTFLSGNAAYAGAGTIYVEQGAYAGNDPGGVIDFNSPTYDLSNIRNADLTVTGGWNPGSGAVDPANTSNFTDTRILIGSSTSPWGGSVSINNITMTFSSANGEIPATPENALTVVSAGDVSLSNVSISNAPSAGADIEAAGNVTIDDSKFHRNKTHGANIRAGGNVTVTDSEFQNPRVTRQRRQIVGMDINSGGAVTLANVVANGNREEGVDIVAAGAVTIGNSVFSGMKEIDDTEFLGFGLRVVTPAEINVDSVTANDNFLWGAWLDGGGPIAVANSIFNANTTESPGFIDDTGLFIYGDNIVSLFNVTASENRLYGAWIETAGNVSINQSTFNNNRGVTDTGTGNTFHGHGLFVDTDADILINNTTATGNMLFGAELNAGGQVAISADIGSTSDFSNTGTGAAGGEGQSLQITSGGNTSLTNVVLNNNQSFGAEIQSGGFVWLENVTANDNGADGVALQATCTHLIGGTYSGNGQYGLNLGNSALNLLVPPTFSGNGAGDMFPENPPTCSFSFGGSTGAATNIFTSQVSATAANADAGDSQSMSLNQFLASSRTAHGSIFFGQYAYADTAAGIQVFALVPAFDVLAKE